MSLAAELAEIETAVAAARRAGAEGDAVALDGLDAAVAQACDAARALPAGERQAVADALVRLADALDGLANDIARQAEAARRRRAADAYGDASEGNR